MESTLSEIESSQDADLYGELLEGVRWRPAERKTKDELYSRGFGRLELPFSDHFSARIARPKWQQFIALRLVCSSPQHQELRDAVIHLNPPRLPLSQVRLPNFSRFPNLRTLHLYLDEKPLEPANLALPRLEELSLFGPGFESLSGAEYSKSLREIDLRWQCSPSLEPLRGKQSLERANLIFHEGILDLEPLSTTGLKKAWVFGPDLRTEKLLEAPLLRELKITTEGSFRVGAANSKLERLEVERARKVSLGNIPCLRECHCLGSYPQGTEMVFTRPLPSLFELDIIAYKQPSPDLAQCKNLRYLRARPFQASNFQGFRGLKQCSQLREIELWDGYPEIPELRKLPRLQRIEPQPVEKEIFDTSRRSTIEADELGTDLEAILHSECDLDQACTMLDQWLESPDCRKLLRSLLKESRLLSTGQVWLPPGSYLRGHPEERWETWDRENNPRTSFSQRQAMLRYLMSRTEATPEVAKCLKYVEYSEKPVHLTWLSTYRNLRWVRLKSPSFFSLDELQALEHLQSLALDGPLGSDLSALRGCRQLTELVICQSRKVEPLKSLKGIGELTSLRRLELRTAGNPDLSELEATAVEELVLLTGGACRLPTVKTLKSLRAPDLL